MITLQKNGCYKLVETKHHTKILYLDNAAYAWIEPLRMGEILVVSHNPHITDCILSLGHYRLYTVRDELELHDMQHLELEVGRNTWQGYLLLTGLPDDFRKRARIVPTSELASNVTLHKYSNKQPRLMAGAVS